MRAESRNRPTILVFRDWYLPGILGAGTIKSLRNLVEHLGTEFTFRIVTRNCDHLSDEPYPGVPVDTWLPVGPAQVCYRSERSMTPLGIRKVVRDVDYQLIYITSVMSPLFSLLPVAMRALGMLRHVPLVISPKGELARALANRLKIRNVVLSTILRYSGLYRKVYWQATSPQEHEDLRMLLGRRAKIHDAPELPDKIDLSEIAPLKSKKPGSLRLAYVSRIVKSKNLLFALEVLRAVRGEVEFDIYGPPEDRDYWRGCQDVIARLPASIHVRYRGALDMSEVVSTLRRSQVFLFPSLSESYGFVILEALSAGCPVIISDRTPWKDLAQSGIGRELPLESPARFTAAVQEMVDMPEEQFERMSARAFEHARDIRARSAGVQEVRDLLHTALRRD